MQPGDVVMTKARGTGFLPAFPAWDLVPWAAAAVVVHLAPVGQPALVLDWLARRHTDDGAAKVRFADGTEVWIMDAYLTRLGEDEAYDEVDVREP